PARVVDPSPPGQAVAVSAARPAAAGGVQPDAAAPLLARVHCAAGDTPALAPTACGSALDGSAPTSWTAADRVWGPRAGRPFGAREPELGLSADHGRAAQARHRRRGDLRTQHPVQGGAAADAATPLAVVAELPANAWRIDPRLRLPDGRHDLAAPPV